LPVSVQDALEHFVSQYQKTYSELTEVHDPEWRSPCETAAPYRDETGVMRVPWQPLKRGLDTTIVHDFAGLENALETTIHPDIKAYYGGYWSGGLEADAPQGHVSLIFLWNQQDAERLIANLIGHAMAKRRNRVPLSVFFACTEVDSELFLSVENTTGQVLLEKPGHKPVEVIADDLATFIDSLVPAAPELHPERRQLV
jgi:SecY interacting protein Syd